MENQEPLYLAYDPKRSRHVKDSLYYMMAGGALSNEWEINRRKLYESGFQLVIDSVRAGSIIPSSVTFHHYPSDSTVLVVDDHFNPHVKIHGSRREEAMNSLVTLVKPYGFDLRETTSRKLFS